jgi:PTS system beta-glucosides-specific IIC component
MEENKMAKYDVLTSEIIKNVGGKENVVGVTHCLTRLRFSLKDMGLVNEKALLKLDGVVTAQSAGGQYQVVIGSHVSDVHKELIGKLGLSVQDRSEVDEPKKGALNRVIEIITKVITPVLNVLIATGLIQGTLALLTALGVIQSTDGAYILLNAMGNALFQFFPIILGYTSAKAFNMSGYVGMLIGAIMVFPGMTASLAGGDALYTLFSGTIFQTAVYKTFFGIPIMFPATGYASTVVPIIFANYFASKVEHFFKERIPAIVGFTLVPFLTLVISAPVVILIVGPIANFASLLITAAVTSLYDISPILTAIVVAFFYQPLVILGLHWPLVTLAITNFVGTGNDYILPMIYTASFAQTAVVVAVYVRTKSKRMKGVCIPAIISGLFCIIEPAIYGVTLPVKKRFAFSMIGGVVGAAILAAFDVRMYAISVGVLGIVGFLNPAGGTPTGLIIAIVATVAAMVAAFVLTYITFGKDSEDEAENGLPEADARKPLYDKIVLDAPIKGAVRPLEQAEDAAFSNGALGKGILILPEDGKVIAPCDGELTTLFDTGHAIGITADSGLEILIHVGKDTVRLEGRHFTKVMAQGDRVKRGDVIVEFDMKAIKELGYNLETPVLISNSDAYLEVIPAKIDAVDYLEPILTVIPFQSKVAESNLQGVSGGLA